MDTRCTPHPVDPDGQNGGSGALLALEESRQEIARLRALLGKAHNETQKMSPRLTPSKREDMSAAGFVLKAMRLRTSGPSFTHSSEASRAGPPAAIGHTAVSYRDRVEEEERNGKEGATMVIFGGSQVSSTPATDDEGLYGAECAPKRGFTNDVWSFSDKKGWGLMRCEGEIPAPRACHAAAVVGDTLYVYGGYRDVTAGQQVPHVPFYPSPNKKNRTAKSNNSEGKHDQQREEENDGAVSTGLPTIASDCTMSPTRLGQKGNPSSKSKTKRREKKSNKDKAARAAASVHHPQHLCTLYALDLSSGKWRSVVPDVKGGTDTNGGMCVHSNAATAAASSNSRKTATISGHIACAAKGKVYFFGGSEVLQCSSMGSLSEPSGKTEKRGKSVLVEAVNTVRCYDPRRNSWEDEADLNWQMEQRRRRQRHEGSRQEDDGGAGAEVDSVVPPPFTNCLCALCADLASTSEQKTHRSTASVSYSQSEDAFYVPLVVCGPSPSPSNGEGGEGRRPAQLACRVYRYDRVRCEWSVVRTTGIGPTCSRRGSFSSAIVGRLLIVFHGHNVNVLDTVAGHWYEVPVGQHSRSLPDGTGRSCVVVDHHTGQGQPEGGGGSQQLATQTRNRGVSLLLFGGLKYQRTKQDCEDRESKNKDKDRGPTIEKDVAEESPSRDLWRVDILPSSESAIPLFAESGGTVPARNHSNNGTRSGSVGGASKGMCGPPRCASITPATPRRPPVGGGVHHQTSPSPTRANHTFFIAPSPPSAAAGDSGRSHSRGRSGSQQLCDKGNNTNNPRWATLHPRPFSSQTSRHLSRQYFSTYTPHHTPSTANSSGAAEDSRSTVSPKRKSAEEIKKIVERVSDTRVLDIQRKQLEARYLFNPSNAATKTAALTSEEEEASVNRLYYAELEAREERLAELEQKYYPPPPVPDLTEDEVYESVERLYSARKAGGLLPSVHSTAVARHESSSACDTDPNEFDGTLDAKSKVPPLSAHQEAAVKRLYYDQLVKSRESRIALEERYMREWGKKSGEHKHA